MSSEKMTNIAVNVNKGDLIRVFVNKLDREQAEAGIQHLFRCSKLTKLSTTESYLFESIDSNRQSRMVRLSADLNVDEFLNACGSIDYKDRTDFIQHFLYTPYYFGVGVNNWRRWDEKVEAAMKIESLTYWFRLLEPNFPVLDTKYEKDEVIHKFLNEKLPMWFNSMSKNYARVEDNQTSSVVFKNLNHVIHSGILGENRAMFSSNEKKRGNNNRSSLFVELEVLDKISLDINDLYKIIFEEYLGIQDKELAGTDYNPAVMVDYSGFSALIYRNNK
jgi:hypothetical protein